MNSIAMDKFTRSRRFAFMAGAAFLTMLGISATPASNAAEQ